MYKLWELLNQNYIGIILSVLGIILGYIFYRRALPRPKIAYQKVSSRFPSKGIALPPDVDISFRGKKIPHIIKTTIALWNCGNTTINGNQIVEKDPLRIALSPESEIFDASILSGTRAANDVGVIKISENDVKCYFDYLDPKDGMLISIIHTGDGQISVKGTIRGIPEGAFDFGELGIYRAPKLGQFGLLQISALWCMGILYALLSIYFLINEGEGISNNYWFWGYILLSLICALLLWATMWMYFEGRKHPALTSNLSIPEDL